MLHIPKVESVKPLAAIRPFIVSGPMLDCSAGQNVTDASGSRSSLSGLNKTEIKLSNEKVCFSRLTSQWMQTKDRLQATKNDVQHIVKTVLVDTLTSEWISDDLETGHVRMYLMDVILPSIVLCLEKLSIELNKRSLVGTEVLDTEFNPVNFLAQCLMRINPRYSNFSEASSYVRGLRGASEQLKLELFHMTDNK